METIDNSQDSHNSPKKKGKKRGRKPKNITSSSSSEEKKIPKKRGRKPKIKKDVVKVPKKRGRKPTGKILSLTKSKKTNALLLCFTASRC